jgi:hypothetical protein
MDSKRLNVAIPVNEIVSPLGNSGKPDENDVGTYCSKVAYSSQCCPFLKTNLNLFHYFGTQGFQKRCDQ